MAYHDGAVGQPRSPPWRLRWYGSRARRRVACGHERAISLAPRTPTQYLSAATKKIHHFAYLRDSLGKNPRLHELRDGEAFAEILDALHALGFRYGGLHLNYPVAPRDDALPKYHPSDVIVLTTRPPLDDQVGWDRRRIERSNTKLEHQILRHVRPCFHTCKRTVIQIAHAAAKHLGRFADRGNIQFRLYKQSRSELYRGAYYQKTRDPHSRRTRPSVETEPRTAAFLLVRRLGPKGPTLIVAFGMDGIMTLTWCYLLRTQFAHLLRTPRFVMAEIKPRPIPKNAQSLAFADAWRVKILLDLPVDVLGPPPLDLEHGPR